MYPVKNKPPWDPRRRRRDTQTKEGGNVWPVHRQWSQHSHQFIYRHLLLQLHVSDSIRSLQFTWWLSILHMAGSNKFLLIYNFILIFVVLVITRWMAKTQKPPDRSENKSWFWVWRSVCSVLQSPGDPTTQPSNWWANRMMSRTIKMNASV